MSYPDTLLTQKFTDYSQITFSDSFFFLPAGARYLSSLSTLSIYFLSVGDESRGLAYARHYIPRTPSEPLNFTPNLHLSCSLYLLNLGPIPFVGIYRFCAGRAVTGHIRLTKDPIAFVAVIIFCS